MDLEKWQSQLRKGVIEYGILLFIRAHKRAYGLEIIEGLASHGLLITEGTLYPLLSRLTREDLLAPKWETENLSGHPRKYYELTKRGQKVVDIMSEQWGNLSRTFTSLDRFRK